ncbi:hypothetical protein GGI00_004526, partial [Coemansia sp. RSA 2681]
MESSQDRGKPRESDFIAANYLDAFSNIDRSIRDLIDGHHHHMVRSPTTRGSPRPTTKLAVGHASALLSPNKRSIHKPSSSPRSSAPPLPPLPSPPPVPAKFAVTQFKPTHVGGNYEQEGEGEEEGGDEAAAVAFLCCGLPHYEGPSPIYYTNLSISLDAYYRSSARNTALRLDDFGATITVAAAAENDGEEDEEHIPEAAWDIPRPPRLTAAATASSLLSPQTLAGSPRDAGLSTFEGWIDFEELQLAVNAALVIPNGDDDDSASVLYSIGKRTETDYMVYYAIDSMPVSSSSSSSRPSATGDATGDGSWAVQIPKPAVPQGVFESEIISLAYVNEHTKLPVAQILAYNFSSTNPVGVPYAIVTRMPGESLAAHWHLLNSRQKRKVLDQIAEFIVQLSELQFPRIGSLVAGDGELAIGPLLDARQNEPGYCMTAAAAVAATSQSNLPQLPNPYGPFSTTTAYYRAMITASVDALHALDHHTSGGEPLLDRIELETYATFVDRFVVNKYDNGPFVLMPESFDLHHFTIDRRT